MVARFDEDGLHFRYPENWVLDRVETENGFALTVQSPDTAFFMLSLHADLPSPHHLADTALAALREEYPDLEADEAQGTLAGLPAFGHDVRFFSLDLTNTVWARSFDTSHGTIFVMWQVNDLEASRNARVLEAICQSLSVDED